ncbi:MAG: AbrB/MazE/SpoVT family DNA-binding domain-containing protein [Chloroflexi bacterium]|nr:AbrB/MazE/SpoVT family DNA-binding domain-containing protein [Chloroflexota bacterium]
MQSRVQKWGNSLAVRIPKAFAHEIGLEGDAKVNISLEDGRLIVEPVRESPVTLERLLAQVTETNIHHEVNTGTAVGQEAW